MERCAIGISAMKLLVRPGLMRNINIMNSICQEERLMLYFLRVRFAARNL